VGIGTGSVGVELPRDEGKENVRVGRDLDIDLSRRSIVRWAGRDVSVGIERGQAGQAGGTCVEDHMLVLRLVVVRKSCQLFNPGKYDRPRLTCMMSRTSSSNSGIGWDGSSLVLTCLSGMGPRSMRNAQEGKRTITRTIRDSLHPPDPILVPDVAVPIGRPVQRRVVEHQQPLSDVQFIGSAGQVTGR
jgi:hypothetical protein